MKLTGKILIYAASFAAITALASCEKDYYKDEMYRKEVYIVSGENNIFQQEFTFGGDTGYISVYASGVTAIDEDVTVEIGYDYEALGEYNKRNFDQDYGSYAEALPGEYYSMESPTVTLRSGAEMPYVTLPIEVTIDDLLVDSEYFIPLRIESVSTFMASPSKDYVLLQVCLKNDYATTKTTTYYRMNGVTVQGKFHNDEFQPTANEQVINNSKLLTPINKRSVRMLPGAKSAESDYEMRNWSIAVTVDPIQTVDIYILDSDGLPTEEYNTYKRVFVKPYMEGNDAVQVRDLPEQPSYYDPETKAFMLNYVYKIPSESSWFGVAEYMYDTRY